MSNRTLSKLLLVSLALVSATLSAAPGRDQPYPTSAPTAEELASQVYFVNHFYAVDNYSFERDGKGNVAVLVLRADDRKPKVNVFRRYLNNAYSEGEIKSRDLALFHSGKLNGMILLVTEYRDEARSQSYQMWLPALRKIRSFREPAHDAVWSSSDFTYGDVYLRKPEHEDHQLLGEETFADCLGAMQFDASTRNKRYFKTLYSEQCAARGKPVYKLKSTSRFDSWWYDYRVSYIDRETFADYRTDYYKDGQHIKRIDRDWAAMAERGDDMFQDPRAVYWRYWYGKDYRSGHETMINVPAEVIRWNIELDDNLWSEQTLRKQMDK